MRCSSKIRPARGGIISSSSRGGLISHRSHSTLISLIRQNLGDDNLRTMLSSCFGHLFYLDNIKFQGQLYNLLLRSLDKPSLARNRMSFHICGRIIDFSPREFCLITGLKFSDWYDPPVESEFHRSVFSKKQQISLVDLIKAFKVECKANGGTSTLSLRLAFLLVLYGVLLVVGNTNNSIDKSYMHLIDDLDKFNAFPWGCVVYMCLVKRTHRAREILEKILINGKKIAFDANGFVIALQVWAYEVVPILSRNCATRIEGVEVPLPRMRKWSAMNHLKFEFLNKLLLNSENEILETIKLTSFEEKWINNLGGVHRFEDTIVSMISEEIQPLFCKNFNSVGNDAFVDNTEQMDSVKPTANLDSIAKRMAELQECMNTFTKIQMENVGERSKNGNMKSPKIQDKVFSSKSCKRTRLQSSKRKMCSEGGSTPEPCKRMRTTSSEITINLNKSKTPKDIKNAEVVGNSNSMIFYPNEPTFKGSAMKTFEDWCSVAKKKPELGRLVLPFYRGVPINDKWFSKLLERRGWLDTEHIESLLNVITLKTKHNPNCVFTDWTFMDMFCWGALTSRNVRTIRERVGPYLCGIQPRCGHLHWSVARKVFGIGHVNGNHWISFVVYLDECRIVVYDSNSTSWPNLNATFNVVATNLENMMQELRIWELRGLPVEQHFEVVSYENTPQQKNTADCGVLSIKFFECFANSVPVDDVDTTRCGVFRRSFAKQIFDLAIPDTTTIEVESE